MSKSAWHVNVVKVCRAAPAMTLALLILTASCAHGLVETSASDGDVPEAAAVDDGGPSSDESVVATDSAAVVTDAAITDSARPVDATTATCPSNWKSPTTPAGCHCAAPMPCTPNGCYGGYWCNTTGLTCHATPPPGCM